MIVDGRLRTLGTIGELASAVGRTSHTVRKWERHGLIPPPRSPSSQDNRAHDDGCTRSS
jgi:hypothetical protein